MNKVVASFTEAERNLIVFVLAVMALGAGIVSWRNANQATMTFAPAASSAVADTSKALADGRPPGLEESGRVNINVADQQLLETLPGIGPAMAKTILRYREVNGAFKSSADLDNVPGIGPAKLMKLEPMVSFGAVAEMGGAGSSDAKGAGAEGNVAARQQPLTNAPATLQAQSVAVGGGNVAGSSPAPSPLLPPDRININKATAQELDKLHGVGPALAQRIIEYRVQSGPFKSVAELDNVKGVGPKILEKNAGLISVD